MNNLAWFLWFNLILKFKNNNKGDDTFKSVIWGSFGVQIKDERVLWFLKDWKQVLQAKLWGMGKGSWRPTLHFFCRAWEKGGKQAWGLWGVHAPWPGELPNMAPSLGLLGYFTSFCVIATGILCLQKLWANSPSEAAGQYLHCLSPMKLENLWVEWNSRGRPRNVIREIDPSPLEGPCFVPPQCLCCSCSHPTLPLPVECSFSICLPMSKGEAIFHVKFSHKGLSDFLYLLMCIFL